MELHEILAIYRKRAKLKQIEVAEKLGVTGGTYAAIEQGKTAVTIDRLFEFISIFGEEFAMIIIVYIQNKTLKLLFKEDNLNVTTEWEKEMKKGSLDIDNFLLIAKKGEIELMKKAIEY